MKILVTGGAGFIGSHVVDEYIKIGHQVVVVDNLSSGRKDNINNRAKFYQADIRDKEEIKHIFGTERPDVVNHHAAVVEVIKSMEDPTLVSEINILGLENILNIGGKIGIKKFIFSSSAAIYGQPETIPVKESANVLPISPYGHSKFIGEEDIKFFSRLHNFKYLIFRYANVYGPRQNPKGEAGVVAIFSGLLKDGKQPTIFGDGTKKRDYVHVFDITKANLLGLNRGDNIIVNLGTSKLTTDKEIFDEVSKNFKQNIEPHFAPCRDGEIYEIAIDYSLAKEKLEWVPEINIQDGIKNTTQTFLNN